METTRVLTSLLVLTLTGPTLGYPYTRDVAARASGRGRDQMMDYNLGDYLGGYTQDQQYGVPEYEPSPRYTYAAQRPRINAEDLAALLSYLSTANDDYDYDYNSYSDDDGIWYDDTANNDADTDSVNSQDAALLQLLLNHRAGSSSPVRYSLEDLENLEREAEMEDNTENQLHALMEKKINKKSSMPVLGGHLAVGTRLLRKGQKEEAYDIPATSVRRPVFARTITTQPEEQTDTQSSNNNGSSHKPQLVKKAASGCSTSSCNNDVTSNTDESSSSGAAPETVTMTPYIQDRYEALKKYLGRERKVRQLQDMEMELQEQRRSAPQKRFVAEQESLTQQLANLKSMA